MGLDERDAFAQHPPGDIRPPWGHWSPLQGGQQTGMVKELQWPRRGWSISPIISKGGKKARMTSQSFRFPRKAPSRGLTTPMSQTSQMEGRQAELDTLPSAKYRRPIFSLPWSQPVYTANKNSLIIESEHPFAPAFPTPHPPGDLPCPPASSAAVMKAPSHPHRLLSVPCIPGETEMLGDVLKSKLTSLAMHGCC